MSYNGNMCWTTNEELNNALYRKISKEQEMYRDWLLSQPPEEILDHAYEYITKADIVLSLEELDLTDRQCITLLELQSPLEDIFKDFAERESDYMNDIRDTIECRANVTIRGE